MSLTTYFRISACLAFAALTVIGAQAKDIGPTNVSCDQYEKTSSAWMDCAKAAPATAGPAQADAELFYAGYWLAKNGRYEEALKYLNKATVKNARVLTYIGFATRKLGHTDEAMKYYDEALQRDPKNDVARSYLGEAHLSRGDLQAALSELSKIENGCGRNCAPYTELATQIEEFKKG